MQAAVERRRMPFVVAGTAAAGLAARPAPSITLAASTPTLAHAVVPLEMP